jgi:capsid portal protein
MAIERNILLVTALEEVASQDAELSKIFHSIPEEMIELFHNPQNYIGEAPQKANQIADYADEVLVRMAT